MKTIKYYVQIQYIECVKQTIEKNTKYIVKTPFLEDMQITSETHFTNQRILNLGILIGKAIMLKNWIENESKDDK
jgi:hypothetical protein